MRQSRALRGKSNTVQNIWQARVADANRPIGPPRGLECLSWRRLVALY